MTEIFRKLEHSGYLDSVISDLEERARLLKNNLPTKETKEQRIKALDNHVKVLELVKNHLNFNFERVQRERKEVARRDEWNVQTK